MELVYILYVCIFPSPCIEGKKQQRRKGRDDLKKSDKIMDLCPTIPAGRSGVKQMIRSIPNK